MLKKTAIGAIVFYVGDIDRTEAFYKETLGFDLQRMEGDANEFDGADWLMADVGGISLVFFQMEGKRGDSPVIVFNLDEGGIDGIVEGLASKGVTIVTPVSHAPDGGWTADFNDPDGHTLSLYQDADKAR
jgi:glyoxylase I family protein